MDNLGQLRCFVAVVDRGSFTRAAEQLGLSKAMVSMHVKQLEAELGVALLARTTRHVTPTDAGRRFHENCVRVLRLAEAAISDARFDHTSLNGLLRVTTTAEYGTHLLVLALAEFAGMHPRLQIELSVSARLATLVAERFDVAIRMGKLRDSSDRQATLGHFRVLAVAAPAYIAGRPRPRKPEDLVELDWITHTGFDAPHVWTSSGKRGTRHTVRVTGRIKADSAAVLLAFVLAGRGVAILPEWLIAEARAAGQLVELLPEFRLPDEGVFAVYPDTDYVPAKVRQFVDFVRGYVAR